MHPTSSPTGSILVTLRGWWIGYLRSIGRGPVANEFEWHERHSFWPGRTHDGQLSHIYRRRKLPSGAWEVVYMPEPEGDGYWP